MGWPIMRGKSYVDETGKSMRAEQLGALNGLLVKNRDYTQ
jgi:hypothetical protein